jgi:hypothetical protein
MQTKRPNLRPWVQPSVAGDWSFGHTNPAKVPREIATWDEPKLLSTVIAEGPYDEKRLQGKEQNLVSLWLYWVPEQPSTSTVVAPSGTGPLTPTPRGRPKKEKGVKSELIIKKEDNIKDEPSTPAKRSRAASGTGVATRAARRQARTQPREEDDEPEDAYALLGRAVARAREAGKGKVGEAEGGEAEGSEGTDEEVPTPLA